MRTSVLGLLAAAALVVGAGAHAAPIFTIAGGQSFDDVGNDFLWIDSDITEGGTLALSEPALVTIEYLGKEAGFPATEFWFGALGPPGGTKIVSTNAGVPVIEGSTAAGSFPPPGITRDLAPYTTPSPAGTVPFYVRVPGNAGAIVPNGTESGGGSAPDLGFWWKSDTGELGNVVYVLLDDGGGLNPGEPSDNDHDDMIVRLSARAVPEPGTALLALLGFGLLGSVTPRS